MDLVLADVVVRVGVVVRAPIEGRGFVVGVVVVAVAVVVVELESEVRSRT